MAQCITKWLIVLFCLLQPTLAYDQDFKGYPLESRYNFTINSTQALKASIKCVFSNKNTNAVDLHIRTQPHQIEPDIIINLSAASNERAYVLTKKFHIRLLKYWWCGIFDPQWRQLAAPYCSYFSIASANNSQLNPFFSVPLKEKNKKTDFNCEIIKPKQRIRIYTQSV